MKFKINFLAGLLLLSFPVLLSSCGDDDPPPMENPEEEITRVVATFINATNASDVVTAVWYDADGEGTGAPVIDDIALTANTEYDLVLTLLNTLATPEEDISDEVEEEAEEHLFFFGFTTDIFTDPAGNGNIDNRADDVNYHDSDANGEPLGLATSWTTGEAATGEFQVILKHQPGIKSSTSTSADGETDLNITFPLIITE